MAAEASRPHRIEADDIVLYSLDKPLAIALIAGSVWISVTFIIDPAALLGEYAWLVSEKCFAAAAILIAAWVVSSFVYNFINLYGRWMASQTETDLDDRIIRVLEVSARYIIWFIAILMVLQMLEVNITPLVAGAGLAGLAVALAAQDIVSNFFGGAVILVDKPFAVGDRIKIDEFLGDVISIGPGAPGSRRWTTRWSPFRTRRYRAASSSTTPCRTSS